AAADRLQRRGLPGALDAVRRGDRRARDAPRGPARQARRESAAAATRGRACATQDDGRAGCAQPKRSRSRARHVYWAIMSSDQVTGAGSAAPAPSRTSEADFRALYERLRAQVPWGPADRRGALNYLTQADVLAACGAVRLGRTVSLAAPVEDWVAPD